MPHLRGDDSGAIAVMVAIFAVVLFGFAALIVDVGNASAIRARASAAADAGALAGEDKLAAWANMPGGGPIAAFEPTLVDAVKAAVAKTYDVDESAWQSCADTPPSGYTPTLSDPCIQYKVVTFADGTLVRTAVRVRVPPRKAPSTFGGIFGVSSVTISPVAAADAGQDPPPPCQACDPELDMTSGQPVSTATLPDAIRSLLPDPSLVAPAPAVDSNGCPTGPGRFDVDVDVATPDPTTPCVLPPGLYVFNDCALTVNGELRGSDVTLIFYGSDPVPLDVNGSLTLAAPAADEPRVLGDPIPGVAILIDQYDQSTSQQRSFDLGTAFDITGSVYALDGETTWHTDDGDCSLAHTCAIHDDGANERIAVTATSFGDGGQVPMVAADHVAPLPPPQPVHLADPNA